MAWADVKEDVKYLLISAACYLLVFLIGLFGLWLTGSILFAIFLAMFLGFPLVTVASLAMIAFYDDDEFLI